MKLFFRLCFLALAVFFIGARPVLAQPIATATADFGNSKPGRNETAWGRLVADSLRATGKSDIAFLNAGALRGAALEAGPIEKSDIAALLSFGDDEIAVLTLSGAQIRAALERAAGVYPTASPAFLHCSGFVATFDPNGDAGRRVGAIKIKGSALEDDGIFSVAMPVSLSEGAAGYFNIWKGASARRTDVTLQNAIADFARAKKEISPENVARFGPK